MNQNSKITAFFKNFPKNALNYIKQAKVELIVLVSVLAVDLIVKGVVSGNMKVGQSIEVIPNFFHITYVQNTAAAFGGGLFKTDAANRIFFLVVTSVALPFFCYGMYRFRGGHRFSTLCFACIIGGTLGNFIDRIAFAYVRDMFEFMYFGCSIAGSTSFAVFNIADVALVTGVIMFAIYFIFMYKTPQPQFVGPIQQFLGADGEYHPLGYDPTKAQDEISQNETSQTSDNK